MLATELAGAEGELLCATLRVHPRDLEDLLETLARIPFPVNPEIRHGAPDTTVAFPLFSGRLPEVEAVLREGGFGGNALELRAILSPAG